jgi:hypothetical protein
MLDSAVLQHAGAAVTVVTQKDVGVGAPGRQVQDQVTFSGVLLPPASGFLRLLWRGRITDTLRIGKGNVVGIYLAVEHHGSATPAVLLGAVVAGLSATVATGADGSNISSSTRLVIIPAAALIGALVGALVASQEERGVQIYPPLPLGAVAK